MKKELYRQKNPVVNDAFDRLAVEIHLKKQNFNYKSFMLCGCEPGVGTTTIGIDLAISMAAAGWKTLLIDCDMRKEASYKRLNENSEHGLYDYLNGKKSKESIITKTNNENLYYIPSGNGMGGQISLLCSARMQELMKNLKNEYDYIILDVPSLSSSADGLILAGQVDGVVLISAQNYSSIKNIANIKEKLEKANANILGIIANKVNKKEFKKYINYYDYFVNNKYLADKKHKGVVKHETAKK